MYSKNEHMLGKGWCRHIWSNVVKVPAFIYLFIPCRNAVHFFCTYWFCFWHIQPPCFKFLGSPQSQTLQVLVAPTGQGLAEQGIWRIVRQRCALANWGSVGPINSLQCSLASHSRSNPPLSWSPGEIDTLHELETTQNSWGEYKSWSLRLSNYLPQHPSSRMYVVNCYLAQLTFCIARNSMVSSSPSKSHRI